MNIKLVSEEMVDLALLKYKNGLAPYAQELLGRLIPTLRRLDIDQLSASSSLAVEEQRDGFVLTLEVNPSDENIPSLGLRAYPNQCFLDLADSEYLEAHGVPPDWQELVDQVITAAERYLNGVTILEQYNRNHKLIGKAYFYGIDTENDKQSRIGSSSYLVFPRKVKSVVKRTHRFLIE